MKNLFISLLCLIYFSSFGQTTYLVHNFNTYSIDGTQYQPNTVFILEPDATHCSFYYFHIIVPNKIYSLYNVDGVTASSLADVDNFYHTYMLRPPPPSQAYVKYSDTASMLAAYLRLFRYYLDSGSKWVTQYDLDTFKLRIGSGGGSVDTGGLSFRINSKVAKADSNTWTGYLTEAWFNSQMASFEKYSDTAAQMAPYLRKLNATALYQPIGSYALQTTSLTINGTTQDLSTSRTWNVGTVTSLVCGTGLSGGTIISSGTISMPNVGTAATYGDATHVAQITTDAQGRVSSASAVLITGASPTGSAGGDLTGTYPNPTIGSGKVINADLAGSITSSNLVGTDIATVGTVTSGTWAATSIVYAHLTLTNSVVVGDLATSGTASVATFLRGDYSWSSAEDGLAVNSANVVGVNSTETEIVSSPTIAANSLQVGTIIQGILTGTCTSTVSGNTSTITVHYGTAGTKGDATMTATSLGASSSGSGTSNGFRLEYYIKILTTGSSATCQGVLILTNNQASGIAGTATQVIVAGTNNTFNTTTSNNIITFTYKNSAVTTTCGFQFGIINRIYK